MFCIDVIGDGFFMLIIKYDWYKYFDICIVWDGNSRYILLVCLNDNYFIDWLVDCLVVGLLICLLVGWMEGWMD